MPIQSILIYLSLGLHTPYLPVGGWSKLHSGVIRSYHFILFGRYTVYPFTCFKFAGQLPQRFFFFFGFFTFVLAFPRGSWEVIPSPASFLFLGRR